MCDTYVALGNSTKDGNVVFGKNSDRLANEAQIITFAPRKTYAKGEILKCTHIEIPQASKTYEVILSQPYWMWGAEMGANEYGVVIGNEAIATKEPLKESGLLGMDLLRLGLERGKNAKESLDLTIDLLEKYGQGGAHNLKGLNYHNSMIIVDPKEAFVLETAGDWWIVEIVKDIRSISNNVSIRGKGDMRRDGIIQHAVEKGYCKDDNDFDFKMNFSSSPIPEEFPLDSRDGCSHNQLVQKKGKITPPKMMKFLREHDVGICMHGRLDRSTGSQVSLLREGKKSIHFFTGSTIPCLSSFKPYAFPLEGQNAIEAIPYPEINPEWFWTLHNEYVKVLARKPLKENPNRDLHYDIIASDDRWTWERIEDLLLMEKNTPDLTEQEFMDKIKYANKQSWKKAIEMIT